MVFLNLFVIVGVLVAGAIGLWAGPAFCFGVIFGALGQYYFGNTKEQEDRQQKLHHEPPPDP